MNPNIEKTSLRQCLKDGKTVVGTWLQSGSAVAAGQHIVNSNETNVKRALEQVLASSDFVSLHVPLTDSTKNLINSASLAKMKRSAYIINTSRGGVINEQALCEALKNGVIAGAAVDVFEKEPETESKLRGLDNVLLTPHIGTFTEEIFIKMDVVAAQNVVKKLAQK